MVILLYLKIFLFLLGQFLFIFSVSLWHKHINEIKVTISLKIPEVCLLIYAHSIPTPKLSKEYPLQLELPLRTLAMALPWSVIAGDATTSPEPR